MEVATSLLAGLRRTTGWFTIVACLVVPRGAAVGMELNELVIGLQRLADEFNGLPCWEVEYTHAREAHHLPAGFTTEWGNGTFVNAKKGDMAFVYYKLEGNPPLEYWTGWRDGVSTHRIQNGDYQIVPEAHMALMERWYYANNLFIDTHEGQSAPAFKQLLGAASLSEAFWLALPRGIERRPDEWAVLPETQDVDGFPCVVAVRTVDGFSKDTLWVDPDHSFITRKRTYYESPGQLLWEYKNEELVERQPGLWLPNRQVYSMYNDKQTAADIRGKLRYVFTNAVTNFSLNMLDDEYFVAPMIDRGNVNDFARGVVYQVDSQSTTPESRVTKAVAEASVHDHHARLVGSGGARTMIVWNLVGILAITLVLGLRRVARHNA